VDSADSLTQSFNPERYSKVINIARFGSESGEQLGRVLGFSFDIETAASHHPGGSAPSGCRCWVKGL